MVANAQGQQETHETVSSVESTEVQRRTEAAATIFGDMLSTIEKRLNSPAEQQMGKRIDLEGRINTSLEIAVARAAGAAIPDAHDTVGRAEQSMSKVITAQIDNRFSACIRGIEQGNPTEMTNGVRAADVLIADQHRRVEKRQQAMAHVNTTENNQTFRETQSEMAVLESEVAALESVMSTKGTNYVRRLIESQRNQLQLRLDTNPLTNAAKWLQIETAKLDALTQARSEIQSQISSSRQSVESIRQ